MKYDITFACGHTATVQLYGKTADRERKAQWLATQDCPECEKKARTENHQKENAVAAEKAQQKALPDLKGTEKQIAWANTIRIKMVEATEAGIKAQENAVGLPDDRKQAGLAIAKDYLQWLVSHNEAAWWIDRRDKAETSDPWALRKEYKQERK